MAEEYVSPSDIRLPDSPFEHYLSRSGRNHGKSFKQFMKFVECCRSGMRVQLHGTDYVAVDRKTWDELCKKAAEASVESA